MNKLMGLVAVLVLSSGCGGGSGGGGSAPPVITPPAPPTLVSIAITTASPTLEVAQSATLSAVGTYSNGTQQSVSATWALHASTIAAGWYVTPVPPVMRLSGTTGPSITVEAFAEGSATIRATSGGFTANANFTVTYTIPEAPGTVYISNSGDGFMLDRAGTHLYTIGYGTNPATGVWTPAVFKSDLAGESQTVVGYWPPQASAVFTLDYDSQDRIYTLSDSGVSRMDPVTGASSIVALGGDFGVTIGPDDNAYSIPLLGGGAAWITKINLTTGVSSAWGPAGDEFDSMPIGGGLAFNRRGEAFTADAFNPIVYKYVDLNGDGDAMDGGEHVTWAYMPAGYRDCFTFGLTDGPGGSVFVNLQPYYTGIGAGIYWLTDRNGDGLASGDGEVTLYPDGSSSNGRDHGCIAAPR